ncbi:MAG: hypothetical protein L0241_28890 [Planctomycetia bacterium]|nr:hypothetical protein [Planctomycetia bacterium]
MRKALVALNLLVAAASAGLFAYTFFAREHLTGLAEDYVIDKTVHHVSPGVEHIESALKSPAALFVPGHIRDAVQAEVDSFRLDPHAYVRKMVAKGTAIEKPQHLFADQVVKWKESIQKYFDGVMAGLIRDLRIFAGTNVVAALLAAWVASYARGPWRWHVFGVSILLLVALGLQAYLFIDGLTFFRILVDARVGWTYPVAVTFTFAYLYVSYGRFIPPIPTSPKPQAGS